MKCYWVIISTICLGGCLASNGLEYDAVAETNAYHMAKIRKGMSQLQVLHIMHKPYSYETFEAGDDVYDVWFYVTRVTGLDQTRMVPQNLTPLTFKNGVLVGTGYPWYYYAMNAQKEQQAIENPPPPKPKTQDEEDYEFEKALKPFPQKPEQATPPSKPVTKNEPLALGNLKAFNKLHLGMSEDDVMNQVGSPSRTETIENGDDVYTIWFYDKAPLSFKNGVLIGMTQDDYNRIKKAKSPEKGYNREAERMQEEESEQNFDYW